MEIPRRQGPRLPAGDRARKPEGGRSIGSILLDASFSPVRRVSYAVESARVGSAPTSTSWCSTSDQRRRRARAGGPLRGRRARRTALGVRRPEGHRGARRRALVAAGRSDPAAAVDDLELTVRSASCLRRRTSANRRPDPAHRDRAPQDAEPRSQVAGTRSRRCSPRGGTVARHEARELAAGRAPDRRNGRRRGSDAAENREKRALCEAGAAGSRNHRHASPPRTTQAQRTSHRVAMLRNMTNSLFLHGRSARRSRAEGTAPRETEPLITLSKEATLANRRLAFDRLRDPRCVTKLFNELGPRYRTPGWAPADPQVRLPPGRQRAPMALTSSWSTGPRPPGGQKAPAGIGPAARRAIEGRASRPAFAFNRPGGRAAAS